MTMQADQVMEEFLFLTSDRYAEDKFIEHMTQKEDDHFVLKTFAGKGIYKAERIEGTSKGRSKCEGNDKETKSIEENATSFTDMISRFHSNRMKELRSTGEENNDKRNAEKEAMVNEVIRRLIACKKEETMIIKLSDAESMEEVVKEINQVLSDYYDYALKDMNKSDPFYKSMMRNAIASSEGGYAFLRVNSKLESERSDRVLLASMMKVHLLTIVVYAPKSKQTLLELATASRLPLNNSMALSVADIIKEDKDVAIEDAFILKQYLYDTNSLTKISYYQADAIMMNSEIYKRLLRITLARIAMLRTTLPGNGYITKGTADTAKENYASIVHDHNIEYLEEMNRKVNRNKAMVSVPHALLVEDTHHVGVNVTGCNSGSTMFRDGLKIGFGRKIELDYCRVLKPLYM